MTKDEALFAYLESKGFNPYRMGNWNRLEGIGLAESSFLAGWDAAIATSGPTDPGPVVYDPPLTQAEGDAYWAAISDDPEPSERESS